MEALATTFGDLVSVQDDMLERDKQLLALNKEIHKHLSELKSKYSYLMLQLISFKLILDHFFAQYK